MAGKGTKADYRKVKSWVLQNFVTEVQAGKFGDDTTSTELFDYAKGLHDQISADPEKWNLTRVPQVWTVNAWIRTLPLKRSAQDLSYFKIVRYIWAVLTQNQPNKDDEKFVAQGLIDLILGVSGNDAFGLAFHEEVVKRANVGKGRKRTKDSAQRHWQYAYEVMSLRNQGASYEAAIAAIAERAFRHERSIEGYVAQFQKELEAVKTTREVLERYVTHEIENAKTSDDSVSFKTFLQMLNDLEQGKLDTALADLGVLYKYWVVKKLEQAVAPTVTN